MTETESLGKKIIVFGTDTLSDLVSYFIEEQTGCRVEAYTVSSNFLKTETHNGLPVVPFETVESTYSPDHFQMLIAIGYTNVNSVRETFFRESREKGYRHYTFRSMSSTIASNVEVGPNSIIFPGVNIEPFASVGANCILWSGALVAHHSVIEDHCFLAPRVCVAGHCRVGERTFLGANATIHDHIQIGQDCIIGAGSVVRKSVASKSVLIPPRTKVVTDAIEQYTL